MKQRLIMFYYAALILVLSCQALYTVYKLGGTIGQGENIHRLQQQQANLEKDLQTVQEARSASISLTTLAGDAPEGYTTIHRPIIVSKSDSVASAQ